ncbi:radical SAM protein [Candidatus Woesearchaeota archaeon]|nr:radical SAM protein [Candidatus Woesearchaeota archaeon]
MKNCVYTLPCKPGSIYINLGNDCLNDCRFCVKRYGSFFGYDLSVDRSSDILKIVQKGLEDIKTLCDKPKEIVICGIGEPFLHYDEVIQSSNICRKLFGSNTAIRVDTSGLWWQKNQNLSFLDYITSLSVSLNAETEEVYNRICQPRIPNAYRTLRCFLEELVKEREKRASQELNFPEVRLTVVDTSQKEFMPPKRNTDLNEDCPVPDFTLCQIIADSLRFPLIIKKLFRDVHKSCWIPREIEEKTLNGEYLEKCLNCKHRHI